MNIHEIRYLRFIDSRKIRVLPENAIIEKHHIIPKSLGGDNSKENLIKLTPREHFIAHLILWKAYGKSLAQAFFLMNRGKKVSTGKHGCYLTSRQFEVLREEFIKHRSEAMTGNKHPMFGKHLSEETIRKLKESKTGENNPNFGKHPSEETLKKKREAMTGEKHPNFGKHPSEETLKKMSKPRSEEHKKKMRKPKSEEHKKKMSEAKNKPIKCIETNKIYPSIKQAGKSLIIGSSSIAKVCTGKQKTAGKLHFEFVDIP